MKLYQNTFYGRRYKRWTIIETIAYFIKGISRELKLAPLFFNELYEKVAMRAFKKKWLKNENHDGEIRTYYDFKGAKLPEITNNNMLRFFRYSFEDVFLVPCFYNDNYKQDFVRFLDQHVLNESVYGYCDNTINVTIEKGDIVIDAGAWIGDFSAYAASKGAIVYAFEPDLKLFDLLCKTKELNETDEERIFPIQKGLGSGDHKMNFSLDTISGAGNSLVIDRGTNETAVIDVITLDSFVKERHLEKVDFIKADIEGAERDMLRGAFNVLKIHAPKLVICTYHLPDDPEVLEKIILEANPKYKIIHLKKKLFAAVI